MQRISTESVAVPISRRRSTLDVMCEILLELSRAENLTMRRNNILGRCNLTWLRMNFLMEQLAAKGLIEIIRSPYEIRYRKVLCRLTERGFTMAQDYRRIVQNLVDDPYETTTAA